VRRSCVTGFIIIIFKISGLESEIGPAKDTLTNVAQTVSEMTRSRDRIALEANIDHAQAVQLMEHSDGEHAILRTEPDESVSCRVRGVPLAI
jgi:hypothetical protein